MSYPIPGAALDDRLAFVGTSGSGKTYNAGTGVERLLQARARVCIPDPLGVWWGLALQPSGKKPSSFRDRKRDAEITAAGIKAMRYSGSNIHRYTERVVEQILAGLPARGAL